MTCGMMKKTWLSLQTQSLKRLLKSVFNDQQKKGDIEKAVDSLITAAITYGSSPRGFNKTACENHAEMKKYKDAVLSKIEAFIKGESF